MSAERYAPVGVASAPDMLGICVASLSTWMVSDAAENGDLGGVSMEGHGLLEGSEVLGLSSRVQRAAPSLQMPSEKPVVASCGPTKTAIWTMPGLPSSSTLRCCLMADWTWL